MKKTVLPLALALSLALTSCASMLERSYEAVTPHVDRPVTADDPSTLRVENYRELVSAVLYLVSQGQEEGTIQFHDYAGQAETDLAAACLEVADQDPLGAYAVDYIEHEVARVMSYYQAVVSVHYRRSPEQIRSIVNVTGTRAIRDKVETALTEFADQLVLRVSYFAEDELFIRDLARQAFHDAPAAIPELPQLEVTLYPDTGRQRIVEVLLTYSCTPEVLSQRRSALNARAEELALPANLMSAPGPAARVLANSLAGEAACDGQAGSTAYDALVEGRADSEGMALAYLLLVQKSTYRDIIDCRVVEGVRPDDEGAETPHFWDQLTMEGETLYLDPSAEAPELLTAQALQERGYRWGESLSETPAPAESPGP